MPRKILFVDDEAPIRELLSLFFRKKGCEVSTAVNAQEGRTLAEGGAFDLAIVDVNLGAENGLELLGFLKSNYPRMPVIIFTGMADDDEVLNKAMRSGASGFLRKTEPLEKLYQETLKHLPAAS
jgi:DNA-binding NtrC family response regulator